MAVDGFGVVDSAGEGADESPPLAATVAGGAETAAVGTGAGELVAAEGPPIAATPPELPGSDDGPCVEGVVVRAITSTRKARTISATSSAWPPVRPGVTGRDPVRPRDGSSARGVARTAGQRSESDGWRGVASDTDPDHSPAVAMYVAQPVWPAVRAT